MTTLTWTNASSGTWTTAANWSPAQVPGVGDTALVTLPGSYLIGIPGTVEVSSLTLDDAMGEISVGGALQGDASLTITAGTVAVSGFLNTNGFSNSGTVYDTGLIVLEATVAAASVQRIGGSFLGSLYVNGTVTNSGTLDGTSLSTVHIDSLGTVEGGVVANLSDPGLVTLDGVTWQGPLVANWQGTSIASGVVIENGLSLTGPGGIGTGTLSAQADVVSPGGTVEFVGNQTLDNAVVTGFGSILVANTLTIGSGVLLSGTAVPFLCRPKASSATRAR